MVIYEGGEGEGEGCVRRKERWSRGTGPTFELTCYQTHPVKATHLVGFLTQFFFYLPTVSDDVMKVFE